MQKNLAQISFSELLSANEAETQKWRAWFERQPMRCWKFRSASRWRRTYANSCCTFLLSSCAMPSGCRV